MASDTPSARTHNELLTLVDQSFDGRPAGRHRKMAVDMRAAALIVTLALLATCGSGCGGDIRADELSRSVDTLISSAGEGTLLAQGVAEDRTKATFVRVRARELSEVTDHEGEKLNDASADSTLAPKKRAAVALAGQISAALVELQISPTDEEAAKRAERGLTRLASRGERLQSSL